MDIIRELLRDVPIPRLVKIKQTFPSPKVGDVVNALRKELTKPGILDQIKPGMRIAVAVGSRGMAEIQTLVRTTIAAIRDRGGRPFIVPAMGSHGGATADGQTVILAQLGITETSVNCPIIASMEVVQLGTLANGLPVYIDKQAYGADGIVVINRIKPHTAFRGPSESGLVKMITIGLGKQKGADSCHRYGFKHMAENITAMAKVVLSQAPVLFGIGTIESAYEQIAKIVAVPAKEILAADAKLQREAKENLPRLPFDQIDVLVIDQIGKDISGDGMDPNITGRYPTPYASGGPSVSKMVVLDLTEGSHGNANGMGTADFTTRRLANKVKFAITYANVLTSTVVRASHLPMVLESDRLAVQAAIKTCNAFDMAKVHLVRIKDTLHLGEIFISEAMLEEARANPKITVLREPFVWEFDEYGNSLTNYL